MITKIIKLSEKSFKIDEIKIAVETIINGGLVAFPTETVYGLGANAFNIEAVEKIYEVKGRPKDNPFIVHIADKKDVSKLASEIPVKAERLMKKFWPGPLTLIFKKSKVVPDVATAGLDTVAIRMPDNKIASALIKESKVPIAAPSANLAGKPSPTSAEHVINDLYGKIDVIIDSGKTRIGVESTVLDLTTHPPTLLRPGGITLEELESVLGKIKLHPVVKAEREIRKITAKSPGMKYRHYAPEADLIVVEGKERAVRRKIQELVNEYKSEKKKVGIITISKHDYDSDVIKFAGKDLTTIAKNLFRIFREFDKERVNVIIAEGVKTSGMGLAIMNRLKKASGYNVIKA
ncbi:MAG: L-threonylcarbamoyladenylate synthase [Candidatus Aenigmarchaeota archaeon]|nr:L-threonylcarbamoyladenylate synthase [Candidatus Aenigmarchaeota archaeon]